MQECATQMEGVMGFLTDIYHKQEVPVFTETNAYKKMIKSLERCARMDTFTDPSLSIQEAEEQIDMEFLSYQAKQAELDGDMEKAIQLNLKKGDYSRASYLAEVDGQPERAIQILVDKKDFGQAIDLARKLGYEEQAEELSEKLKQRKSNDGFYHGTNPQEEE